MLLWSERYATGIDELDRQHRRLVDGYNTLYGLGLKPTVQVDELIRAYNYLLEQMKIHFIVEECLLSMFGFPDYRAHLRSHKLILERLRQERRQIRLDHRENLPAVLKTLYDALVEHMQEADKHYVTFLQQRGVG